MATAPKDVGQQGNIVLEISPDDIVIGDRLGVFWPDKAAAIGKLMAEDGQNDPIKVRRNGPTAAKPWTLVAGLHRLEGAKAEQLRLIDAIAVTGDDVTLRKIEASENVERGSRGPLERACFVRAIADAAKARLKDLHGDLSPEQIAARARWDTIRSKAPGVVREDELDEAEADDTRLNLSRVYGWRENVAQALDLSLAAIKRDLALHRAIVAPFPHLYRDLATHPIVGDNASALKDIASVKDEGSRRQLIMVLIQHPAMTLIQAKVKVGLSEDTAPAKAGATKHMENATANLARLSAAHQRQIAPEIVATLKPTALIAMRDLLLARIEAEGIAEEKGEDMLPPAAAANAAPVPAVQIRVSVKPDYIACLECGERHTMLKRHLSTNHQLTTDAYLAKWKLPVDYPFVAPNYAEERRQLARKIGLKGGEA